MLAGKTHAIAPELAAFDPGNRTVAWAGVLGGGALLLTSVLVERFAGADEMGGEPVRWGLVGLGLAGFVGGTMMMKDILRKEAKPPLKDGSFDVKVSAASMQRQAAIARR